MPVALATVAWNLRAGHRKIAVGVSFHGTMDCRRVSFHGTMEFVGVSFHGTMECVMRRGTMECVGASWNA